MEQLYLYMDTLSFFIEWLTDQYTEKRHYIVLLSVFFSSDDEMWSIPKVNPHFLIYT